MMDTYENIEAVALLKSMIRAAIRDALNRSQISLPEIVCMLDELKYEQFMKMREN